MPEKNLNLQVYHFASPMIKDTKYSEFRQYFNSIVPCKKLYICYEKEYGSVYVETERHLLELQEQIEKNNKYKIEMRKANTAKLPSMSPSECDITAEVASIYMNGNGQAIGLLKDADTSTEYVSVKDVEKSGLKLYANMENAKMNIITELEEFLTCQANIFMAMKSLKYSIPKDISIKVQFDDTTSNSPKENGSAKKPEKALSDNANVSWDSKMNSQKIRNGFTKMQTNKNGSDNNRILKEMQGNTLSTPESVKETNKEKPLTKENVHNHTRTIEKPVEKQVTNENAKPKLTRSNSKTSLMSRSSSGSTTKSMKEKYMKIKNVSPSPNSGKLQQYPPGSAFISKIVGMTELHLQILQLDSPTTFIGFILSADSFEFDDLLNSSPIENELLTPKPGELVIIKFDEDKLSRAYVMQVKPDKISVASIDYAKVMDVDRVFEFPKQIQGFDEYICVCEAPASYVKDLTVDDAIPVTSPENFMLVDPVSKVEIICKRWIPSLGSPARGPRMSPSPTPKPKPAQKIYMQLTSQPCVLKLQDKVELTQFSQGMLYLRTREIHTLLRTMQNTKLVVLEKPPVVGQYCMHKLANELRRCRVKSITNNEATVEYVDHKATSKALVKDLYNLDDSAAAIPPIIEKRLRCFEDKEYSEKALDKMSQLQMQKFVVTYTVDDIVDLKQNQTAEDLSAILISLDPQIKTIEDLPKEPVNFSKCTTIVVIHNEDEETFFFATKAGKENIDKVSQLSYMADEPVLENVVEGQLVVAFYEDDWYRGQVLAINGQEATIYFLDFGNTNNVEMCHIRAFPDDMLSISPCVSKAVFAKDSAVRGMDTFLNTYTANITLKNNVYHVSVLPPI